MNDRFTGLLSEYLDNDLPRPEYDAVERHLESCAMCRDALSALASVKTRAASLVDPPVPADLWAGIASRMGPAGSSSGVSAPRVAVLELPRRVRSWGPPRWIAVAAAFAMVTAGALWWLQGRPSSPLTPASAETSASRPSASDDEASVAGFDASRIEGEIGQLQQALDRGRGKLDPRTVQVLEENLRIIRKATEDARRALEEDPANRDLQDYLAGSVQRKLDLVRRAAVMAGV